MGQVSQVARYFYRWGKVFRFGESRLRVSGQPALGAPSERDFKRSALVPFIARAVLGRRLGQ